MKLQEFCNKKIQQILRVHLKVGVGHYSD